MAAQAVRATTAAQAVKRTASASVPRLRQRPLRIAVLGAESTGKTQLAGNLAVALREQGRSSVVISEVLREWCERESRTPHPHEQAAIAAEQACRALAPTDADCLIADTTPLMTAVYSELLFDDASLYPFALAHQQHYDLTLLTGLDLPWVADGLQRDGPQVREPVDRLVRAALTRANVPWQVIYGHGPQRLKNALKSINSVAGNDPLTLGYGQKGDQNDAETENTGGWGSICACCGDAECERRLFSELMHGPSRSG